MNTIREIQRINEQELERGMAGTAASWHAQYAKSAWVFIGNLDHSLTEGDLICVMSQYGEIEDLHLVREEETGKSRGFAFCKYEDARSCVLAVDNFCGIQLCGRTIRVDHVENYRLPKNLQEKDIAEDLTQAGQAYRGQEMANKYSLERGQDPFAPVQDDSDGEGSGDDDDDSDSEARKASKRKRKEDRRRKREEKERRRREKEKRRMEREEKKREKRTRKIDTEKDSTYDDVDDDTDRRRSKKKRRYDSDDDASSS